VNPVTHFLASWCLAASAPLERRDRLLVTLAGVAPDFDGLGIVAYALTAHTEAPSRLYHDWHHVLLHNVGACLLFVALAVVLARRRWLTALVVAAAFHLHLLCDVLGSRGPDGHQWPVPYLLPLSDSWQLTWSGQWQLASWQNVTITMVLLGLSFWLARRKGVSFFEVVSARADEAIVAALRKPFTP